jgi:hypothetical protein
MSDLTEEPLVLDGTKYELEMTDDGRLTDPLREEESIP